ncbi:MAG: hypothetical protein ACE5JL_12880, partial [Dehalococcoidia bacterium]
MKRIALLIVLVLPLPLLQSTRTVHAHGFGERYDLPVPLWLYLYGAGATVLVSFVIVGWFVRARATGQSYPRYHLLQYHWLRSVLETPLLLTLLRLIAVSLLGLVIATAFFGERAPLENFSIIFVWVIWWVGFGFVVAFLGNLWALINPWKVAFEWAEKLYSLINSNRPLSLGKPYP